MELKSKLIVILVTLCYSLCITSQVKTINYKNGNKYVGEVKNGLRSGKGCLTKKNGNKYSGYWENNKMNGKMEIEYHNGNKFVGVYKNDIRQYGKMHFSNGDVYEPQWKGDIIEGYGIYDYQCGDRYSGNYLNGKKHGEGVYNWSGGVSFVGNWENGKRTGEGWLYFPEEKIWEIFEWDNDTIQKHLGTITYDEKGEKVFDDSNLDDDMLWWAYSQMELEEEFPNKHITQKSVNKNASDKNTIKWNSTNKTIEQISWNSDKYVFFYPYSSNTGKLSGYGFAFDDYIYSGFLKSNSFVLYRIKDIMILQVKIDEFAIDYSYVNNELHRIVIGDNYIRHIFIKGNMKNEEIIKKKDGKSVWNEMVLFFKKIKEYHGETKVIYGSGVKEEMDTIIMLDGLYR